MALGTFRDDHAGLVAACRRIIDRQLTCAPLWWLCARMLCSPDPRREAHAAAAELESDPTAGQLGPALPEGGVVALVGWPEQSAAALARRGDLELLVVDVAGEASDVVRQLERLDIDATEVPARCVASAVAESDLVLLEALAVGPERALAPAGSVAAAAVAARLGRPVWLVGGVGRLLPGSMFDALERRWGESVEPLEATEELLALDGIERLAGIAGVVTVAEGLTRTDTPVAPELFRLAG